MIEPGSITECECQLTANEVSFFTSYPIIEHFQQAAQTSNYFNSTFSAAVIRESASLS